MAVVGAIPALAQEAAKPAERKPPEKAEATDETQEPVRLEEEVTVKGFRASLEQSVELKRLAVNARDSIVTEDIGKMPDLNLAEAIQRVPGVAIVREGGEGRQMSLRGLGAEFTRVTLNGMEVPASVGGLDSFGGVNRGRSFDFNVFSADLFSRIDVNKTSTAAIEEGGVAGAVDMYTMRPLSQPGFRSSFSVQGGYNDVSEKYDPRVSGTISATNKAETFGFVASAAYTGRTPFQDGFGTVRWSLPERPFRGNSTSLSTAVVNSLWYPRLPRQDSFRHDQERLGLSSGLQFRPNSRFEAGVNWVHSTFKATTNSYNSFAQFRRSAPWGFDTITPTSVTVATDGNSSYAIAGSFQNVSLRTESRENADETKFNQLTADFKYELNPNLVVTGMVGRAQSKYLDDYFRANIETPGTTFSYDFTANPNVASIRYGLDVTNPANYVLQNNELFQQFNVDRTNDTARLDLEWGLSGRKHVMKFGGIYNNREVDSRQAIQDVGPPGLAAISKVFSYVDVGGFGSATTLDFLVLDFAKARAAYGFGNFTDVRGPGRTTWLVAEKTAGAYLDYTLFTQLDGRGFRVNAGARFVNTKTEATGWLSQTLSNTEDNSYNDLLPALNIAFDATSKLVLRVAASRSLTRPSLASLAPIKTYSDVNFTVAGGNSQLEPLKADAIDFGAEWYFAEASVLGFNVFYKDVKSFISSPQTSEPLRAEDFAAVPERTPRGSWASFWSRLVTDGVSGPAAIVTT